jgi:hypothetical protein
MGDVPKRDDGIYRIYINFTVYQNTYIFYCISKYKTFTFYISEKPANYHDPIRHNNFAFVIARHPGK